MFSGLALRLTLAAMLTAWGSLPGVMTDNAPFHVSQVDQFAGRYVLLRDPSEDLKQAINRATSTVSFVRRAMVRWQLRQRAVAYSSFVMGRAGESLRTILADKGSLSLPLSGSPVLWKAPFGEIVRAHLQLGTELVEVFEAKRGRCESHFQLSPDRQVLVVEIRMISEELPEPVEYRLVYRRA
ncbi:MAG: hypothetical protein JO150_16420 [Acidobacteriaceae bacterium]|nr:hypothetical protein [Acidobacteriaceae bacterium]